jgi:uncharacterized membrane-anchored protein YjiN (DUF445 family)
MRAVAVCLLLAAAVVYAVTFGDGGFLGYVNAGAEASMVGAMADWFAVTALFKHPLGLPIPHTALIPRRKDMLGRSLQEFVTENFLQEEVVRDRIRVARVSERVGEWFAKPANAAWLVDETASVLAIALAKIRDEDMADLVRETLLPRLLAEPISPLAGGILEEVVRDRAHHGLVDLALAEAHRWLQENEATFADLVAERAPWWSPQMLNDRVTRRLHIELLAWIEDIQEDPQHDARLAFDRLLGKLAQDLLEDPETQQRAENLKNRVLGQPQVVATATSLWNAVRRAVVEALEDEEGYLRRRGLEELRAFAERLRDDPQLQERMDGHVADAAVFAVSRYGHELTAVITHTIDRWDGREASRRIELHVGRDLQFIRINGTVVGGLVGVVIHAASVLLH